jgi:hypothetical protein
VNEIFILEGFETLDSARDGMGIEALGSALAGFRLKAFRINFCGEMFLIDPSAWRTQNAREMIETGRTIGHFNRSTRQRGRGELIVVRRTVDQKPVVATTKSNPGARVSRPPRKRGQAAVVLERVKAKMRSFDLKVLASLTEEAMKAEFGASRDTCRRARKEIQSEIVE